MRMLAVFQKDERIRHIGHLDIMRAMQRALRRSGLPAAYSNGFNPHILLTFASALPVGAAGRRELLDAVLRADVPPEKFVSQMNRALPPEMRISSARVLDDKHASLMSAVRAADYEIRIQNAETAAKLAETAAAFMAQETVMMLRKTKSRELECDIKPMIFGVTVAGDTVKARLALSERETCRADLLIAAMCRFADCEAPRILPVRTQLYGRAEDESFRPLEEM